MIVLRDYQEAAVQGVREALREVDSVLLQCPTGGGKTAMAANMAGTASGRGRRVFFICHRDFLVEQTSKSFHKAGIAHAFIAAGWMWNPFARVQICSIDTLKNRLDKVEPPDLCIWDEAHHTSAAGWAKVKAWASRAKHVGLSATPCRLDGKGLDIHFQRMVLGPSVSWLIQQGHLSQYRAFAPSTPDLAGVHTRAGDYAKGDLATAMDKRVLIGDMVRTYRERAMGLRAVYFCVSIEHSRHVAETFNAAGVPALHLDGSTPPAERKAAAKAFARGEVLVLTNVDLFGEGYDLAAQAGMDVSIDAVGLARPTQSLGLHLQQIGRALRPRAGKDFAVVLDHADNIKRHGFPDDAREWSLSGVAAAKRGASGDNGPPVRQCPRCFCVHAPRPSCPSCGHHYESQAREVEHVEGELHEVYRPAAQAAGPRTEADCKTLEELLAFGRAQGRKDAAQWAAKVWTIRRARATQALGMAPRYASGRM